MFGQRVFFVVFAFLSLATSANAYTLRGVEMHDQMPGGTANWVNGRSPVILRYVVPTPEETEKAIREKRTILIGKIILDAATVISFYEKPTDLDHDEVLNSTVVIKRRGLAPKRYNVGELIHHQSLWLAYVGLVRFEGGETMLVCNYAGGATGGHQGFAILRFTPSGFALNILPLTDHGKVVVFKSNPERAELWTGTDDHVACEACLRSYAAQVCNWGIDAYRCGPLKPKRRLFGTNSIIDPGIEIRP